MTSARRLAKFCAALVLATMCGRLSAQELTLLGGAMRTSHENSYTWQIDYRQILHPNLAASIAYINEGHVINHHRDGSAFEAWGQWPLDDYRITLSLGAGAYYFFDTQGLPGGDSLDVHGTAPIVSFAATGYFSSRWFYRATVNRIAPANDLKVTTGAIGVGFWFGDERRPTPSTLGNPAADRAYVTGSEVNLYGGQSVVNTLFSESALAWGAEYRRGFLHHVDGTVSYVHEGDPRVIRRSGVAAQAWAVNTFLDHRLSVGAGLGPYFYIDRRHPRPGHLKNSAVAAPLASLTFAWRLDDHWHARTVWNRVTTDYNRDADVFLAGLGYSWR